MSTLAPYLIYRHMIKSNQYFTKNSLVTIDEFIDDIRPENIYLVRDIFKPDQVVPKEHVISLLSYTGDVIEKTYQELIILDDLNLNINRNYIFSKDNNDALET